MTMLAAHKKTSIAQRLLGLGISLTGVILLIVLTDSRAIIGRFWLNEGMRALAQLGMADIDSVTELVPPLRHAELSLERASRFLPSYPFLNERKAFTCAALSLPPEHEDQTVIDEADVVALFLHYGDQALLNKRVITALAWYQKATKAFPNQWEPWFRIGRIARIQQSPAREIQAYQRTISLQPNNRDIWYALGVAYEEQQDWKEALAAYQRGLSASSGRVGISNVYYRIGRRYQDMKDDSHWQDAWDAYAQAYALNDFTQGDENLVNTLRRRGELMVDRKQWVKAEAEFRQALELDPDNYWVHIALAQALWALDRRGEAKTMLQAAIELNPNDANAYRYLGDYYRAEGDIVNARSMYLQLLEIKPDSEPTQQKLEALGNH